MAARRCCSTRTSPPPRGWSLCTPGGRPPTPAPWGRTSARAGRRGESPPRARSATARAGPSSTRRSRACCTRSSCIRSRARAWPREEAARTLLWARGAPPEAPNASPHPAVGFSSNGRWYPHHRLARASYCSRDRLAVRAELRSRRTELGAVFISHRVVVRIIAVKGSAPSRRRARPRRSRSRRRRLRRRRRIFVFSPQVAVVASGGPPRQRAMSSSSARSFSAAAAAPPERRSLGARVILGVERSPRARACRSRRRARSSPPRVAERGAPRAHHRARGWGRRGRRRRRGGDRGCSYPNRRLAGSGRGGSADIARRRSESSRASSRRRRAAARLCAHRNGTTAAGISARRGRRGVPIEIAEQAATPTKPSGNASRRDDRGGDMNPARGAILRRAAAVEADALRVAQDGVDGFFSGGRVGARHAARSLASRVCWFFACEHNITVNAPLSASSPPRSTMEDDPRGASTARARPTRRRTATAKWCTPPGSGRRWRRTRRAHPPSGIFRRDPLSGPDRALLGGFPSPAADAAGYRVESEGRAGPRRTRPGTVPAHHPRGGERCVLLAASARTASGTTRASKIARRQRRSTASAHTTASAIDGRSLSGARRRRAQLRRTRRGLAATTTERVSTHGADHTKNQTPVRGRISGT